MPTDANPEAPNRKPENPAPQRTCKRELQTCFPKPGLEEALDGDQGQIFIDPEGAEERRPVHHAEAVRVEVQHAFPEAGAHGGQRH